jgi:hypothetical protein
MNKLRLASLTFGLALCLSASGLSAQQPKRAGPTEEQLQVVKKAFEKMGGTFHFETADPQGERFPECASCPFAVE